MAKEIFIKYNPYRLQTEVTIDGDPVKQNSKFNVGEKRLQEWIDKLPEYVREEFNTRDVEIVFYGTKLDYEDLKEIADEANIKTKYLPAKEGVENKEAAIQAVFEKIQNGPIDELKSPDVIRAFKQAQSNDFEVNVVATMSSGKSTLINSLLSKKLMPAFNQACTATITRIKDTDTEGYKARVFDNDGNLVKKVSKLDYETMSELNSDDVVSEIHVEGDIPFVNTRDTNLVLVDTPGPNNSQNAQHPATTFKALKDSPKTVVLYVINGTQIGINDDDLLLSSVAESMEAGGKRSHDRFIFVVNKMDQFKPKEESVEKMLLDVRDYLEDKGIKNPNIYPASALAALNIRTILSQDDLEKDEDDIDDDVYEARGMVRKFRRNPELHFEKYAPLQRSKKIKIDNDLENAIESKNRNKQALIHSGIPSIEEAISLYVEKYAKTAKIKNIVDTFEKRLESAKTMANLQEEIAKNKDKQEEISNQIENIRKKINDGQQAKKYIDSIESLNADKEIKEGKNKILIEAQKLIRKSQNKLRASNKKEISLSEGKRKGEELSKEISQIQGKFQTDLEELIKTIISDNAQKLFNGYTARLASLTKEASIDKIKIDPVKLMLGEVSIDTNELMDRVKYTEEVVVDTVYVENANKKWYKPWTWFQESGHYEDITEDREMINIENLAELFVESAQKSMVMNGEAAVKYAKEQVETVKKNFINKVNKLDKILNEKMDEIDGKKLEGKALEDKVRVIEEKRTWLNEVDSELQAILEI